MIDLACSSPEEIICNVLLFLFEPVSYFVNLIYLSDQNSQNNTSKLYFSAKSHHPHLSVIVVCNDHVNLAAFLVTSIPGVCSVCDIQN